MIEKSVQKTIKLNSTPQSVCVGGMARIQDISSSVEAAVPVVEVNDHNNNNEGTSRTFIETNVSCFQ
jgi:hypothetical protein